MTGRVTEDQTFWDDFARYDPLWAILSDPSKAGRHWDLRVFWRPGGAKSRCCSISCARSASLSSATAALDFGCGVGRLSQPLAAHFDRVVGVDISAEMIRLANDINQRPERVRYVCNVTGDLDLFASDEFAFIYSNVVLQHIVPSLRCCT